MRLRLGGGLALALVASSASASMHVESMREADEALGLLGVKK